MGDFSRDTFDPTNNYVAVRLQQGVPVLDADWNELNDITRHEIYDGLHLTFSDGIQPGGFDFEVLQTSPGTNDFRILAGTALLLGRPVHVRENLRYSTQPWSDPKRAVRHGVAVIPPLTIPTGPSGTQPRTDIVYLDVWEREVGGNEDDNLINPTIGIETSVRLKREAAVRVAEGTPTPPSAPAGHVFMPLALLHRPVNQATITAEHIEDNRPFFHSPRGSRVVSFFPAFLPISTTPFFTTDVPAWRITFATLSSPLGQLVPKFRALKAQNEAAAGVLPLILPDRARLTFLSLRGDISVANGQVQFQLLRIRHNVFSSGTQAQANEFYDILFDRTIRSQISGTHVFNTTFGFSTAEPKLVVDNSRYYYCLFAETSSTPSYSASIHGVSLHYEYFGLVRPSHDHD